MNNAVNETFSLPSKGQMYDTIFEPKVTLRSMTTMEELQRNSSASDYYKNLCDVIEACIVNKADIPVSVYDMCIGDFQYLLYMLRTVTWGSEYKMVCTCPNCGESVPFTVKLDEIEVHEYDEDVISKASEFELPVSKDKIKLTCQTPRILDLISSKGKEMKLKQQKKGLTVLDYESLYTAMYFIESINGKHFDEIALEKYVRELSLKDYYEIIKRGNELNRKVGLDNSVIAKCTNCNYDIVTPFRLTTEFFVPTL